MSRISSELMENRLRELRNAIGDETLHIVCGERCRIETHMQCDSRFCRHMGSGTMDALDTGFIPRSQLFDCVTSAIAAIYRTRRCAEFGTCKP